jgi:hypothetical protein
MGKRRKSKAVGRGGAGPNADVELFVGDGALAAEEVPRFVAPVDVFITHRRHRLADPQGASTKAVLDAIVRAGVLVDDNAGQVREIRDRQEKIAKSEPEETEVEIRVVGSGVPAGWDR